MFKTKKNVHFAVFTIFLFVPLVSLSQDVTIDRTLPDMSEVLQRQPTGKFSGTPSSHKLLSVDETKRFQQIDGWGASFTESSTWLLETKLSAQQRREVLNELLDPASGIGLNFLRQPLGASDFARAHYSFDEMPKGETDPGLKHFSLHHDDETVLPLLQEAVASHPKMKIMLTPWSPPGWMKTKGTMIGGILLESAYRDYANYLIRAITGYQVAGIPVEYLSVQNEPLNETQNYPGSLMPAAQQKAFIRDVLGPAMEKAHLRTKILIYDHNWDHPEYPEEILNDPAAAHYVAGTAFHCYGGDIQAQTQLHDRFPSKGVWETECSGGSWQSGNLLAATGRLIIESTRHWAKSVVLWNMALDQKNGPYSGGCDTCRGLITVDHSHTPSTVTRNIDYYAMGQASRFVRPGATRIASNNLEQDQLYSVAFQNTDGSIALIVLNDQTQAVPFDLKWHDLFLATTAPAGSLTTYLWKTRAR